ncbi:UvrD-helicase domain-containing protein [Flavobacterium proteolyticum]|uniref:DNA 3'-5' helicase II n=1 Tax=Flavobacterium proteolyticum TaxID=2911683 RepID=A0ABR9WUS2_9FLAO|nr:UvrD-helicase domain-containing protein [Flavobacterium proteolyticum]MBE9577414.1 ATP-dependent helicase [Flavobacterium proteolyticum]
MKIEINPEHIKEAAKLLIGGNNFDDERIEFITNLDTCDLLAVPGSGKTTALLAKLYCLSKQMPFNDGSGILVLSHTNNAVDEIEKKLKKHCPHLFENPNFVGTIQTFVNKYLANQGCFEKYGSYISKNDDDLINEYISKKVFYQKDSKIFGNLSNILKTKNNIITKQFLKLKGIDDTDDLILKYKDLGVIDKNNVFGSIKENYNKIKSSTLSYEEKKILFDFNDFLKSLSTEIKNYIDIIKIIKYDEQNECFHSNDFPKTWKNKLKFSTDSGKELKIIFDELKFNGSLKYFDSFEISNYYISKFPAIKSILQRRFKYVFVDEMQDLEKYQIDIIENIFNENNSKTIIQRIGDPNQAIYNSNSKKVKIECDWKERKPLFLKGSNRLTKLNSNLVNRFILDSKKDKAGIPKFIVESKGEEGIKPHLIVFSHETKHLLKDKFKELINKHNLHHCEKNKENGFKIIGWSAVWDEKKEDNENIRLQDVFPEYSKESKAKKEDFSTLSKHLQLFDENKKTLEAVRKSILNALIYILLLENEKYKTIVRGKEVERRYSKSEMIKHIQSLQLEEKHPLAYEVFKEKLFKWCFDLVTKKNYEAVFNSIKEFINTEFREWFELNESLKPATQLFILNFEKEVKPVKEIIKEEDISIDIATIHSVKGQTHCATMYIETFKNNYESQKTQIINVLTNKDHNFIVGEKNKGKNAGEKDAFGKEALKMMYVGFSRPTHLLCFAALEENVKGNIEKYKNAGWVVID